MEQVFPEGQGSLSLKLLEWCHKSVPQNVDELDLAI